MHRRRFLVLTGGALALAVGARSRHALAPWRVVPRFVRGVSASGAVAPACLFCGISSLEQPLVASGTLHFTPCCLELAALVFEEDPPPPRTRSGRACCRCGAGHPLIAGPADCLCRACVDDSAAARRSLLHAHELARSA
ncbi:MAG TPA: hypothetical protein VGM56_15620 [Byssovorax sp.]